MVSKSKNNPQIRAWIFLLIASILVFSTLFLNFGQAEAHRSGCHRWHSCPSDTGSYVCGDAGHPCQYPTYPASGGVIYPPSGYYKDCYTCSVKKVPSALIGSIYLSLKKGDENNSVKRLQLGLIQEGTYEEAIASGYYGTLTENAIKNFQRKYGIISYGTPSTTGYGNFGPRTRAKFNEIFGQEDSSSNVENQAAAASSPIISNADLTANNNICHQYYGVNSYWNGSKNESGAIVCACDVGYGWNFGKSGCVSNDSSYVDKGSSGTSGVDYYLRSSTCIGLSGQQYADCILYALNH